MYLLAVLYLYWIKAVESSVVHFMNKNVDNKTKQMMCEVRLGGMNTENRIRN